MEETLSSEILEFETQTDILTLLENVKCQDSNPSSLKQALLALASLCSSNSESQDYFRLAGGVEQLKSVLIDGSCPLLAVPAALFCLACAVRQNVNSQNAVLTDEIFMVIHKLLTHKASCDKLIQAAAFLLACSVDGNGRGQLQASETGCLQDLMYLLRKCVNEDSADDNWLTITRAIGLCVNNPQNEQNQRICCSVVPYILRVIGTDANHKFMCSLLTLLGLIVANNASNQNRVRNCGGIESLVGFIKKQMSNEDLNLGSSIISHAVSALDACIADNEESCKQAGNLGLVVILLDLLGDKGMFEPHETQILILALAHVLESASEFCHLVDGEGYSTLVDHLTDTKDEELFKALKYILTICKGDRQEQRKESSGPSTHGRTQHKDREEEISTTGDLEQSARNLTSYIHESLNALSDQLNSLGSMSKSINWMQKTGLVPPQLSSAGVESAFPNGDPNMRSSYMSPCTSSISETFQRHKIAAHSAQSKVRESPCTSHISETCQRQRNIADSIQSKMREADGVPTTWRHHRPEFISDGMEPMKQYQKCSSRYFVDERGKQLQNKMCVDNASDLCSREKGRQYDPPHESKLYDRCCYSQYENTHSYTDNNSSRRDLHRSELNKTTVPNLEESWRVGNKTPAESYGRENDFMTRSDRGATGGNCMPDAGKSQESHEIYYFDKYVAEEISVTFDTPNNRSERVASQMQGDIIRPASGFDSMLGRDGFGRNSPHHQDINSYHSNASNTGSVYGLNDTRKIDCGLQLNNFQHQVQGSSSFRTPCQYNSAGAVSLSHPNKSFQRPNTEYFGPRDGKMADTTEVVGMLNTSTISNPDVRVRCSPFTRQGILEPVSQQYHSGVLPHRDQPQHELREGSTGTRNILQQRQSKAHSSPGNLSTNCTSPRSNGSSHIHDSYSGGTCMPSPSCVAATHNQPGSVLDNVESHAADTSSPPLSTLQKYQFHMFDQFQKMMSSLFVSMMPASARQASPQIHSETIQSQALPPQCTNNSNVSDMQPLFMQNESNATSSVDGNLEIALECVRENGDKISSCEKTKQNRSNDTVEVSLEPHVSQNLMQENGDSDGFSAALVGNFDKSCKQNMDQEISNLPSRLGEESGKEDALSNKKRNKCLLRDGEVAIQHENNFLLDIRKLKGTDNIISPAFQRHNNSSSDFRKLDGITGRGNIISPVVQHQNNLQSDMTVLDGIKGTDNFISPVTPHGTSNILHTKAALPKQPQSTEDDGIFIKPIHPACHVLLKSKSHFVEKNKSNLRLTQTPPSFRTCSTKFSPDRTNRKTAKALRTPIASPALSEFDSKLKIMAMKEPREAVVHTKSKYVDQSTEQVENTVKPNVTDKKMNMDKHRSQQVNQPQSSLRMGTLTSRDRLMDTTGPCYSVDSQCPGCKVGPGLNSRTFNIAIETSKYTCYYHHSLREHEKRIIHRRVHKQETSESRYRDDDEVDVKRVCNRERDIYSFQSGSSEDISSHHRQPIRDRGKCDHVEKPLRHRHDKKKRRSRIPYTKQERLNLLEGAAKMGKRWQQILCTYQFHESRTAVDLKDKYKRLMAEQHRRQKLKRECLD